MKPATEGVNRDIAGVSHDQPIHSQVWIVGDVRREAIEGFDGYLREARNDVGASVMGRIIQRDSISSALDEGRARRVCCSDAGISYRVGTSLCAKQEPTSHSQYDEHRAADDALLNLRTP